MTKSKLSSSSSSSFPFHTIVVTSPDAESAKAASDGPLQPSSLHANVKGSSKNAAGIQIFSTSDPFDTRVGSGGGTLAALDIAHGGYGYNPGHNNNTHHGQKELEEQKSVLIIHAGGQSSRCPTQITLGKAWTSLPISSNANISTNHGTKGDSNTSIIDNNNGHNQNAITNPTYILMDALSKVLANLPNGSVVVAASDVLLSLPMQHPISFDQFPHHDKVIGLAVPAPLETAKNHGVFALEKEDHNDNKYDDHLNYMKRIHTFLQKPSVAKMKNHSSTSSRTSYCVFEKNGQDVAWIDTGVIIFLPKAAQVLREMMSNDLSVCTRSGIERLFKDKMMKHDDDDHDRCQLDAKKIKDFANDVSVKVELYSHLLLAIPTKGSLEISHEARLANYLSDSMNMDLSSNLLEYIFNRFAKFELQVCVIPDGGFIHLGTTYELRQFLIHGAGSNDIISMDFKEDNDEVNRCREFGRRIGLVHKSQVIGNDTVVDPDCVVLNSSFPFFNNDKMSSKLIRSGTVIEHSIFHKDNFTIGSNCLVSGFRGEWNERVIIPDNFVFQLIKLKSNWREVLGSNDSVQSDEDYFVCVYHHGNDAIKEETTCFGLSFEELFMKTGLNCNDLWEKKEKKQLLWTAKINPIIKKDSKGLFDWSVFSWIEHISSPMKEDFRISLDGWKSHDRMSLAQLRSVADASFEFSLRMNLQSTLLSASKVHASLIGRLNEEIDLAYALIDYEGFLIYANTLENVVTKSVQDDMNDICSRAFMLLSTLLRDLSLRNVAKTNQSFDDEFNVANELRILSSNGGYDLKKIAIRNIFGYCERIVYDNFSCKRSLVHFANMLEDLGHNFTKSCVASGISIQRRQCQCPLGSWVVAKAPCRIDIFGGWSDTPPISYEYGGSVATIAVLVNKQKPLSAKCRLSQNVSGIVLRTESRDIDTNELLWHDQVHVERVQDLLDYNDPTASCALLKCALLIYGLVPIEVLHYSDRSGESIQSFLDQLCNNAGYGMELVSISLLPKGSGMGSSSILAGCILASLGNCLGLCLDKDNQEDKKGLTKAILLVEQLLTTGGGWQDQVGGLYGGLKLGMSKKYKLPMEVRVERHDVALDTIHELNQRLILVFTGQPRLARNILRNVLKQWSARQHLIVSTVHDLVHGAKEAVTALKNNDLCRLGKLLSLYWQKKMIMAGKDSGVEPPIVQDVINILQDNHIIDGATLCGAGGGGFLVAIAKKGKTQHEAQKCIETHASKSNLDIGNFTWYECDMSCDGLIVSVEE